MSAAQGHRLDRGSLPHTEVLTAPRLPTLIFRNWHHTFRRCSPSSFVPPKLWGSITGASKPFRFESGFSPREQELAPSYRGGKRGPAS